MSERSYDVLVFPFNQQTLVKDVGKRGEFVRELNRVADLGWRVLQISESGSQLLVYIEIEA